jgi:hypothetical protein
MRYLLFASHVAISSPSSPITVLASPCDQKLDAQQTAAAEATAQRDRACSIEATADAAEDAIGLSHSEHKRPKPSKTRRRFGGSERREGSAERRRVCERCDNPMAFSAAIVAVTFSEAIGAVAFSPASVRSFDCSRKPRTKILIAEAPHHSHFVRCRIPDCDRGQIDAVEGRRFHHCVVGHVFEDEPLPNL